MLNNRTAATSLVVFALLLASGVFAVSARSGHTELLVHFVMPGRDTECEMVDPDVYNGNVTCAIHRRRFRGSGGFDEEKPSRRWFVDVTRLPQVFLSRRDFGSAPPKLLRYGQTLRVGFFRCTSRPAGLTCVSRSSGHGFFLSSRNKSQRVF